MAVQGGSLVECEPAAAAGPQGSDGLVCLARGADVLVFSSSGSGARARTLRAHTSRVTGVQPSCHDSRRVHTCGLDGTVRAWSPAFSSAEESNHRLQLPFPVHSFALLPGPASSELALLACAKRHGRALQLRIADLSSLTLSPISLAKLSCSATHVTASSNGSTAAVADRRTLFLWNPQALLSSESDRRSAASKPITLHHTKNFTCVTLSPNGDRAAAGDVSGRIVLWHGLRQQLNSPSEPQSGSKGISANVASTTLHWHPSSVTTLRFSSDGAHLYSGGYEGVVVQWDLQSYDKSHLPRLGAPIRWLCLDGSATLLAALQDNSVRRLAFSNKTQRCIASGIRPHRLFSSPGARTRWAAFDRRTGSVIFAASPASLQLFNLATEEEKSVFPLHRRDPASAVAGSSQGLSDSDRDEGGVEHIAISSDGSCMATVDRRLEHAPGSSERWHEDTLRFWDRSNQPSAVFVLSTKADDPHLSPVVALAHSPNERLAATASEAGELRLWAGRAQSKAWRCKSANARNGTPIRSLEFSDDGSTLAAGSNGFVELWDHCSNMLVQTLGCHESSAQIEELAFVPYTALLAGIDGASGVVLVWHLPSLAVAARIKCNARTMAAETKGARLAIAARPEDAAPSAEDMVTVLECTTSGVVSSYTYRSGLDGPVEFLAFPSANRIAVISREREYVLLERRSATEHGKMDQSNDTAMEIDSEEHREDAQASKAEAQNGLTRIFGSGSAVRQPEEASERHKLIVPVGEVTKAPSSALPPISTLCSSLLNQYLEQ